MCRHLLVLCLCTGALGWAAPAWAQTVEELEARVADARISLAVAEAAEDSARGRLDSTRIGTLRLLGRPELLSRNEPAAERAWASLRRALGPDTTIVSGLIIYLYEDPNRSTFSGAAGTVRLGDSGPSSMFPGGAEHVQPLRLRRTYSVSAVANSIERVVYDHVFYRVMPESVREWLDAPTSFDTVSRGEWTGSYIALATSDLNIGHQCFQRNIAACTKALWLTVSETPNVDWFTTAEAQALAQNSMAFTAMQCAGDVTQCPEFLRTTLPRPPLDYNTRQRLFRLALEVGGEGAIHRFLLAPDRIEARLEAASGTDLGSLVEEWTTRVHNAPPPGSGFSTRSGTVTVIWILVVFGAALRSSRWR